MGPSHYGQLVNCGTSDQNSRRPGELLDTVGPRAPARVAQDSRLTPGYLGPKRKSPGTARVRSEWPERAGGHRGPSGSGLRRPGRLVNTAGPPTRSLVSQDSWSTPQVLGPKLECPGTVGRSTGPPARARVALDSWSTSRAFRPGPQSPGTGGRPHGPSDSSASVPGHLVHPAGPRNRARVARGIWLTPRALGTGPSRPGDLEDT